MKKTAVKALEIVKKQDEGFNASTIWETGDVFVLIDETIGVPPYFVSKNDYSVRIADWSSHKDREIAYKIATYVGRVDS